MLHRSRAKRRAEGARTTFFTCYLLHVLLALQVREGAQEAIEKEIVGGLPAKVPRRRSESLRGRGAHGRALHHNGDRDAQLVVVARGRRRRRRRVRRRRRAGRRIVADLAEVGAP